jgi:hypothetical protein
MREMSIDENNKRNITPIHSEISRFSRGTIQETKKIQTAKLNRRDQVTAANSWPSSLRKEGNRGRLSGSSTY